VWRRPPIISPSKCKIYHATTGQSVSRNRTDAGRQAHLVQLVDVITALEDGFASKQLGEDAAHAPDIDGGRLASDVSNAWLPLSANRLRT